MFDVESFTVSMFSMHVPILLHGIVLTFFFFSFFFLLSTNFSPLSTELWLPRTNNTG